MEPVYITESCLECHGDPAGEIDIKGYPKEGMQLGDIAGVASITMPTQTFDTTLGENVLRESMLLFLVLASGLAVIFFGISRLVTRPLKKLQVSMGHIEEGRFDEGLASLTVGNNPGERDEIADLTKHFRSMACQLKSLCENLSTQVSERTAQLKEANDILEEQRAHLEQNNRKLLEDNRYKTDFLSIMSHELRTPLTSVLAFVDVWANTYEPRDANEKKIVDEIASNTQVILSIVNNILEAARMEAGKQTLNLDEVDLFDLVPMVKEQTLALAEKKGIEMTVSLDRTMPVISADEEKLRRILENLVSNAIKFTGEGGSVRISALHDAERGMAVLRVEDNGQGISPEEPRARVRQLHTGHVAGKPHRRRQRPGAFGGEAACRTARRMGGSGFAGRRGERVFGVGADAGRRRREQRRRRRLGRRERRRGRRRGMKVMLADDEENIRTLISHLLVEEGYECCMAEDGSEALALAQEQHPDLIILDIMMPKVNGFDCCTALREMGVEAPIIFLTAKGDIVDKSVGFKAGADDYLVKPFIPQELLLRIEALLRRSKAASQDQGTQKGNMPERLEFPGLDIDAKTRKVHVRGQAVDLTPKEFHLLYMLACNAGRVFTRSQIIEDVWGDEYSENTQSVTVLVRRIRTKIEQDPSNPRYLQTVWHVGYCFRGGAE